MFESVAKTNTTHTKSIVYRNNVEFESVAKTNTTHTLLSVSKEDTSLRVLLKQIQPTRLSFCIIAIHV